MWDAAIDRISSEQCLWSFIALVVPSVCNTLPMSKDLNTKELVNWSQCLARSVSVSKSLANDSKTILLTAGAVCVCSNNHVKGCIDKPKDVDISNISNLEQTTQLSEVVYTHALI